MNPKLNQFLIEIKSNSDSIGTPIYFENGKLYEDLRSCKYELIEVKENRIYLSRMAERNFNHMLEFKGEPLEYTPPIAEVLLRSHPLMLNSFADLKNAWKISWVKTIVGILIIAFFTYLGLY